MFEKIELKSLFTEEDIQNGIKEVSKKINAYYKGEEVTLICILKGAVMFMVDLSKHLTMPLTMEFMRLSSYGDKFKSSGNVRAADIEFPDLNGKNILVVEDIIDTGKSMSHFKDYILKKYSPKSFKICTLLDKPCNRECEIEPDFSALEVDNKFLVGYGLDYKGYYRNIPYIGYVEQ